MFLNVNEIFLSLQGESTYSGLPCIFVRLAGCNLNCSYCDTKYAFLKYKKMSIDDILNKIEQYNCKLVEITGGEPLLQENTKKIINMLIDKKYKVLLETNGSIDISSLHDKVVVILDVKCPSSNESDKNYFENLKKLQTHCQVKFVIQDKEDYKYAKKIIEEYKICENEILFSPVLSSLKAKTLSDWILEDSLNVRLQLQLHKVIGVR